MRRNEEFNLEDPFIKGMPYGELPLLNVLAGGKIETDLSPEEIDFQKDLVPKMEILRRAKSLSENKDFAYRKEWTSNN